ncbi:hypothetical protein AA0488_2624 [Kozakia baliensis NRIC 0488]|uniref:Uncharacterized protein n=1 Tax=Kozakia baliensis TaxID=153496 RepID=A0A1D8UXV8_9PROT|nr:hypothetical protein [Kozakia baliensis]AOX18538.1 hypothetical protein A0U89_14710 [Kozakia baliensis]GBR32798.1 hypothetical protein AA0488_2624 [Kozakia baliensis NRIC 0488]GEL65599.1 hypothetical protein KBA01_28850 [Kozakia baliensis]
MSLSFSTQTSLFDSTALSGGSAHEFWGALEGDEEIIAIPDAEPVRVPRADFRLTSTRDLGIG